MKERDDCPECGAKRSVRYKKKKKVFFCNKCWKEFDQSLEKGAPKEIAKGELLCEECMNPVVKAGNWFKCRNCNIRFKVCPSCKKGYLSEKTDSGSACNRGCVVPGSRLQVGCKCPICGAFARNVLFHKCVRCPAQFYSLPPHHDLKLFGELG